MNYSKSSCKTFLVKISIYFNKSQYISFTKRTDTFWSRDISIIRDIKAFWNISRLYVLDYFKYLEYIFWDKCSKQLDKQKIGKMTRCSQRHLELYQVTKCSITIKLYTIKVILSKNWFYFFFLNFWHAKTSVSFRMSRYYHWFFIYLFRKWSAFFKFNIPS